eukprot:12919537-Prorocentrum_lima.AAC.1
MQQALAYRLLAEQNFPAKPLVESISAHMREQQRSQEAHLILLNEEYHREQMRSRKDREHHGRGNSILT